MLIFFWSSLDLNQLNNNIKTVYFSNKSVLLDNCILFIILFYTFLSLELVQSRAQPREIKYSAFIKIYIIV